jgi:hypothetical protein
MAVPRLDHIVVDVAGDMDRGEAVYRRLGFTFTERTTHSLGSSNHLAMFDTDYLELLNPGNGARPDLAGFTDGLNGLVFAMDDAEAVHADQLARGVPVNPVQNFSRDAKLPNGMEGIARFNTVRLPPRSLFDGRVYFCEHLTPALVWCPELQHHANGALAITRVALACGNPETVAAGFDRMFGDGAVTRATGPDALRVLRAGNVAVEMWPRAALAATLGKAMPDTTGRGDMMALFGLKVRDVAETANYLRGAGFRTLPGADGRIVVPAGEALNVAIEFGP